MRERDAPRIRLCQCFATAEQVMTLALIGVALAMALVAVATNDRVYDVFQLAPLFAAAPRPTSNSVDSSHSPKKP